MVEWLDHRALPGRVARGLSWAIGTPWKQGAGRREADRDVGDRGFGGAPGNHAGAYRFVPRLRQVANSRALGVESLVECGIYLAKPQSYDSRAAWRMKGSSCFTTCEQQDVMFNLAVRIAYFNVH